MVADTELLRRYAESSSEHAFAELVSRHIDFVYAAALRRGRNVADEVGISMAEQWDQIHRLQPAQDYVDEMIGLVPPGSPPITNSQDAQLVRILASSGDGYPGGGDFDPATVDWDKATTQAATILSRPQVEALGAVAQLNRVIKMVNQFLSEQKNPK